MIKKDSIIIFMVNISYIKQKEVFWMNEYFKKNGIYYIALLSLSICLYCISLIYKDRGVPIFIIGLIALILVGILPATFIYKMLHEDRMATWKKEQEQINSIIRHAMDEHCEQTSQTKDILELMLSNMKDLREFYEISRRQAKNAFFLSVLMCVIGAVLLLISITALLFLQKYSETLAIGALGGTIVEVIAGTSLIVYKKSLNQFNHYYRSLHENERFLSILNLTTKLSKEKQDDIYIKIIESQLPYINEENWMNIEKTE